MDKALTQADRLTLYHLSQAFGLAEADFALGEEGGKVHLSLTVPGRTARETEPIDPEFFSDKKHGRDAAIGKAFARAARTLGAVTPPYGTLTGVRPVKVALRFRSMGRSTEEVVRILTEHYFVSPAKAALLAELAETERREARPGEVMLYVSIPFCPSRCSYCSFISSAAPRHLELIPRYLDVLEQDLALAGEALAETGKRISAVYVGGGTPGILSAPQLDRLCRAVRDHFDQSACGEFTVEIGRPDTVTEEKLSVLKEAGVDRVCINPQTTSDAVLAQIGRRHRAADFFRAMETARKIGFTSVNCDLIAGLAGDDREGFLRSVREVLALSPENLTIHALCRKKSAADQESAFGFPGLREAVDEAHGLCIEQGLSPYYLYRQKMAVAGLENLGFAKKGHLCRYNLCMMEDLAHVVACGAGSIGKVIGKSGGKIRRYPEVKYPFEYLDRADRIPALHRAFALALTEEI